MIPILFGSVDMLVVDEQNRILTNEDGELFTVPDVRLDYDTLGIGALGEAISCVVTEERNGRYELRLTYPVTGRRFKDLKEGAVIKATPSKNREPDYFRIYKVTKPLSGIIEVDAEHISYQLSHIPAMPFTATSVGSALLGLKTNSAEANPFTFWTDKSTTGNYRQTVPASVRSRLGGTSGSLLDLYGGEYEFDRYTVKLWANRGADNGVTLRYGKNITDLNQESNIANTITGICPYWADNEGGNVVTLPEKVVQGSKLGSFPYHRTVVKDFSQDFETKPTEAELRARAEAYVQSAGIGVPDVSIDVKFVDLSSTDEGENIGLLEQVKLCDIVTVIFEPFDIEAKAKVTKTIWNTLKDRYDEVILGNARTNLAGIVAANERNQEEALTSAKSSLARAVDQATAQITGVNGGYVVINRDADGNPYELLIMNTPDIETATRVWRWNQNGLGVSNNGYNGPYETAMTADGHFVANFITAGTLIASLIKAGVLSDEAGNFYLDMETGELVMQNGSFSGKIVAGEGEVGGWTIDDDELYNEGSYDMSGWDSLTIAKIQSVIQGYNTQAWGLANGCDIDGNGVVNQADSDIVKYALLGYYASTTGQFKAEVSVANPFNVMSILDKATGETMAQFGMYGLYGHTAKVKTLFTLGNGAGAYSARVALTADGLYFYDANGNLTKTYSAT